MPSKRSSQRRYRSLNRSGKFNVRRVGLRGFWLNDLYHSLLSLQWGLFIGLILAGYLVVNALFASAYLLCGPNALKGMPTEGARFLHAFFFSVQTIATIGYGGIIPSSIAANTLVTVESLCGLLGIALATGLFYARFSRPTSKIAFSHWALIQTHERVPSLMFRLVNQRRNQLIEARIGVVLLRDEKTAEGESYKSFYDLKLERNHSSILPVSWTIVHPIDDESPLKGLFAQDLIDQSAEIIVSLTGMDETFSQNVYARYSYVPEEILWGYRFVDMLERAGGGVLDVFVSRLSDVEPLDAKAGKESS